MTAPTPQLHSTKDLLKILIGAAWIDGVIQPEERNYLHRMATENNLVDDSEIKALLTEVKPVQPQECYLWVKSYLGDRYTHDDYQTLLEAISALIYSDGEVQTQEARFLLQLQELDPDHAHHPSVIESILKTIQQLYRKAIAQDP
jgi:uncharacterized tellurite resistance protein B-like protein